MRRYLIDLSERTLGAFAAALVAHSLPRWWLNCRSAGSTSVRGRGATPCHSPAG